MAASYPSAVKTFATRSNGQTIDASHVNDLQDEVTAIEGGILNGTAPVTCSRVTAASLSVAGNSTISGSLKVDGSFISSGGAAIYSGLNVAGGSTIAGTVVLTNSLFIDGVGSTTLSTGDTHNLDMAGAQFFYIATNSSGSTLTGIAAAGGHGTFRFVFNNGPAVLGIKRLTGSVSSNQFYIPSDTSIAVAGMACFYYNTFDSKWCKVF